MSKTFVDDGPQTEDSLSISRLTKYDEERDLARRYAQEMLLSLSWT